MSRFGMGDEAWAKLDRGLQREIERLRGDAAAEVQVMVSLLGRETEGLVRHLAQQGARDVQAYWINSTVSAHVPIGALNEIGSRGDVKQILLLVRHRAVL
jgi:hypothetical protein